MSDIKTFRGIEHIGITVPDQQAAVEFFQTVFGAEVLFSLVKKDGPSMTAKEIGPKNDLRPGTAMRAVSLLRFGNGPNIEVFEVEGVEGTPVSNIALLGISHFSVTVDDIDAACAAFEAAGGEMLEGPYDLSDQEAGPGNRGRFGRAPWGLLIEIEQLPAPMTYDRVEGETAGRWLPARRG